MDGDQDDVDNEWLKSWLQLNYGSDYVPEYLKHGTTQTDTSNRGKRGKPQWLVSE